MPARVRFVPRFSGVSPKAVRPNQPANLKPHRRTRRQGNQTKAKPEDDDSQSRDLPFDAAGVNSVADCRLPRGAPYSTSIFSPFRLALGDLLDARIQHRPEALEEFEPGGFEMSAGLLRRPQPPQQVAQCRPGSLAETRTGRRCFWDFFVLLFMLSPAVPLPTFRSSSRARTGDSPLIEAGQPDVPPHRAQPR